MLIKFSCCLLLKVDVYVGLSDDQAQRLGNLHNAKRKQTADIYEYVQASQDPTV